MVGGTRHVGHHTGVNSPVVGAKVTPIAYGVGLGAVVEGAAARTFKCLVAQPVGPLIIAVLAGQSLMVVMGLIHMVQIAVHSIPVLFHYLGVAKLFPHRPGYDDTGIGPAQTHVVIAVLAPRCHTGETTRLAL